MTPFSLQLELPELRACLAEASRLEGVDQEACRRLRKKIDEHVFNLVVAGEFKRGKSTVINALLGADLLPTGVVPLTSVVTSLLYGEAAALVVTFEGGESREMALDCLPDYVTEHGNPKNAKRVHEALVRYPAPWLSGGIRLVDTPGIGSIHQHNTEVTYQYLPQADAVIFVASVDQPMTRSELDFLAHIRRYAGKVFCLLNKIDHLSESELAESVAFSSAVLRDALGAPVPVFPVSARLALQGHAESSSESLARSRFPEFDAALNRFLRDEGGTIWAQAARRNLLRLLSEARLAIALEQQALDTPLDLLETNLHAFAVKKRETLQAKADFDALLEAEGKKLLREKVESKLAALQGALAPRLLAVLDTWYGELRSQGAAALQAQLEERLIAEVRAAFDNWRMDTDAAVGEAFEQLCRRFWGSIQATADELLRYSAELFAIPFTAIGAESLWQNRAGFYYKFWREPPALMMLTDGFVRLLPGRLGYPIILRQARRRAAELVDMQAGRLRHDFDERIKESVRNFRREMLERIQATIGGIETAIGKGRALRLQGESEAVLRRDALSATLARIVNLERQLNDEA